MIPGAVLRHQLPGRVRLAVPAMRGDQSYFGRVSEALREACDCRSVSANPRTAGILIDGLRHSLEDLRSIGRRHRCFDLQLPAGSGEARPVSPLAGLPRLDRRTVGAAAFVSLAAIQAIRGQIMVPAASLLWYALETSNWFDVEA